MSVSGKINSERDGHVGFIELDNPPHNYFSIDMLRDITECLEYFEADKTVRSVILCASGKSFCAGSDLGSRESQQKRRHKNEMNPLYQEAYKIFTFPKPIIAALEGSAIGGGLGLALAADFRIGSPEAKFAASFTRLGFHPGFGLSYTLPRVVGKQNAGMLFYTGRTILGEQAREIGLLDVLADRSQVRAEALSLAREIAVSSPRAVQSIRQTMQIGMPEGVLLAMQRESSVQAGQLKSEDVVEGIKAVSERRPPVFSD